MKATSYPSVTHFLLGLAFWVLKVTGWNFGAQTYPDWPTWLYWLECILTSVWLECKECFAASFTYIHSLSGNDGIYSAIMVNIQYYAQYFTWIHASIIPKLGGCTIITVSFSAKETVAWRGLITSPKFTKRQAGFEHLHSGLWTHTFHCSSPLISTVPYTSRILPDGETHQGWGLLKIFLSINRPSIDV
jgi:hypothetical protein